MSDKDANSKKSDWEITQGDYQRRSEATNRHTKQKRKKAVAKRVMIILMYILAAGIITYMYFSFL